LVVLGMHRSGTSAMARCLSLSGAQLPVNLMPAAHGNPDGHWEPQTVSDFNDEVLRSLDARWDDAFGPRRRGNRRLPLSRFVARAQALLAEEYGDADPFVFKEPRTALLLDLWQQAFEAEGVIDYNVIMVRRPDEVADSLVERDGLDRNKVLLLWSTYMTSIEAMTRHRPRIFVSFDQLLSDSESVLDRIEDTFGIDLPRRTWISEDETRHFLRFDRKHQNRSGSIKLPEALRPVRDLFAFFEAAAEGKPANDDVPASVTAWLKSLEGAVGSVLAVAERGATIALHRVAELEAAAGSTSARIAELEQHRSVQDASLASIAERELAAQANARSARDEATVAQGALVAANARIEALERAISDEAAKQQAMVDAANARASEFEQRLGEAESQSRSAISAASARIEALERTLGETDARSQSSLASANAQLKELEEALSASKARAEAEESKAIQLQGSRDAAHARAGELERMLEQNAELARGELLEGRSRLDALAQERDATEALNAELAAQLRQAREEQGVATKAVSELEMRLNEMRAESSRLERSQRELEEERELASQAARQQVTRLENAVRAMEEDKAWKLARQALRLPRWFGFRS
jgi:hypothetical protein